MATAIDSIPESSKRPIALTCGVCELVWIGQKECETIDAPPQKGHPVYEYISE